MNPRVTAVRPNPDYTLTVTFANGEVKRFDVKPYLEIGIFRELKDMSLFNWDMIKIHGILKFVPENCIITCRFDKNTDFTNIGSTSE